MIKRLVKVAKELNVGTATIVEHLVKNGFDIENKPTAKVTAEMYDELLKEFQRSIAIKEQADQLIIGTRPTSPRKDAPKEKPKEEVSLPPPSPAPTEVPPPPPPPPAPVVEEIEEEEIVEMPIPLGLAKVEPVVEAKVETPVVEQAPPPPPPPAPIEVSPPPPVPPAPKTEPVVEKVVEAKVEVEKEKVVPKEEISERPKAKGLKILGKINLDKPKHKKGKNVSKNVRHTEKRGEVKKEQLKPDLKKEVKPVIKVEEKKAVTPVKEEAPKLEVKKEVKPKEQTQQPLKESAPKMDKNGENKSDVSPKKDAPAVEDKTKKVETPAKDSNLVRATTPELRGLKILGKINIETKPKKSKKDKDKNARNTPGKPGVKGDSASDNDSKKRRRKRKKVPKTETTGTQNKTAGTGTGSRTNNNSNNSNNSNNNRGPSGPGNRGGHNRNDRRPSHRNDRPVRGGRRKDEVQEVSQKEIDEKIKATMARLQGGNKKKRQRLRREHRETVREKQEMREQEKEPTGLQLTEFVSVSELASLMNVSVTQVITTCMNLGVIVSINQRLDAEIIELVADEFGHKVEFISAEEIEEEEEEIIDDPADLQPRSPIVTVMGHVDHGKTSLLDHIREANVADGEAGGITQHIGAYEVKTGPDKRKITFLDTPGHEAFTAMRARGAKVTDIAVIIIAADDRIMPQTKEAISHAQAANVPMIFAINKIDKDGAQPERIKQELASMNLLVEEWGGEYQSQDISAKQGTNIDKLLEKILLEAEMLELKANPEREALGTVIEASLDKGRGYVTKILVQSGTLKIGNPIVSGEHSGKVKAMFNERGKKVKKAGPSTPVLVLGLSGAPQAGEKFKVMESEQEARQIAAKRAQIAREQSNRASKRISLDEIGRRLALGNFKELNLIVKGDVDGSIEALSDSLIKQSIETVQVNVIHKAVGQIIESDVLLASASDAIIIGFQVRPSLGARKLAEREGVEIKTYSIIYEAIEEIRTAIEGLLEPTKEEKIVGQVQVREVYKISRVGTIAGAHVQEGKLLRNNFIRIVRNGIVVYPMKEGIMGELASLKRFKDDVKEVKNNMECGITVKNFNDIKIGDIIEAYEIIEIKQTLDKQKR